MTLSPNRTALVYMFLAVICWSAAPLAIGVAGGAESPFIFNFLWKLAAGTFVLAFLFVRYRPLLASHSVRTMIFAKMRSWWFVALLIGEVDIVLLVWSFRYVDAPVASILFELWPVIAIPGGLLIDARRSRNGGERRFQGTTLAIAVPILFAFIGLAFVIISQVDPAGRAGQPSGVHSQILGIALAIFAAICFGIRIPVTVYLGEIWSRSSDPLSETRDLSSHPLSETRRRDLEIFGALAFSAFSVVPVLIICASLAISTELPSVRPETWPWLLILIGGVTGLLVNATSRVLFRVATIITNNLGITAISYLTPVLALGWLFLGSRAGWVDVTVNLDKFIIGTSAIICGNVLINFRAEIRYGFRSLIFALWGCGTFVYFRDELAEQVAMQDWLWPPGEYFTAVGLAATVFTLILSFRAARLVARTHDETNRAFALFSSIDLLAGRAVIGDEVRGFILRIDAPERPEDLADAYRSARQSLRHAYTASLDDADRRELAAAAAELDALAHSRQEGQDFGEYVAMVIFAFITVALILFSVDEGAQGWNGFLIEMFTMLFCAVIIFLVVNVWDLQRERGAPVLRPEVDGGYGVVFRDAVARRFEQWVSSVVVIAMTAAFGWLLWEKWLG